MQPQGGVELRQQRGEQVVDRLLLALHLQRLKRVGRAGRSAGLRHVGRILQRDRHHPGVPAATAAPCGDEGVGQDARQPGARAGALPEAAERAPRFQAGVLQQILGVLAITGQSQRSGAQVRKLGKNNILIYSGRGVRCGQNVLHGDPPAKRLPRPFAGPSGPVIEINRHRGQIVTERRGKGAAAPPRARLPRGMGRCARRPGESRRGGQAPNRANAGSGRAAGRARPGRPPRGAPAADGAAARPAPRNRPAPGTASGCRRCTSAPALSGPPRRPR